MIGSTGANVTGTMSASDYEIWLRVCMYAGYRYSASASVSGNNVTVTWTNWGVAPTYDNWQIIYQVRDSSNVIVQTVDSTYSFLTLSAASQGPSYDWGGYVPGEYASSPPTGTPTPVTGNDSFTLSSPLPAPASYTIWVQVAWNQHKPSATHTFNFPPMSLADERPRRHRRLPNRLVHQLTRSTAQLTYAQPQRPRRPGRPRLPGQPQRPGRPRRPRLLGRPRQQESQGCLETQSAKVICSAATPETSPTRTI